jgi:hypothetical protein
LNAERILSELKLERDRLGRAIEALEGSVGARRSAAPKATAAAPAAGPGRKRGRLTAAGRKRLSEAMKKRWAERRKKA